MTGMPSSSNLKQNRPVDSFTMSRPPTAPLSRPSNCFSSTPSCDRPRQPIWPWRWNSSRSDFPSSARTSSYWNCALRSGLRRSTRKTTDRYSLHVRRASQEPCELSCNGSRLTTNGILPALKVGDHALDGLHPVRSGGVKTCPPLGEGWIGPRRSLFAKQPHGVVEVLLGKLDGAADS